MSTSTRLVKVYCQEKEAVGRDEGGWYRYKEVPELTARLQNRMKRCSGCHDDFYNYRANGGVDHCMFLAQDPHFRRKGNPSCYHR